MAQSPIFICYSHRDTAWKEALCDHLASVGLDSTCAWHDGNIRAGDDFEQRIYAAIDSACLGFVLVSEHSLSSEFIIQKEVPRLLERRGRDGLRVIPIVVRACAWKSIPWVASLELRPKGGTALASLSESDAHQRLAELAGEVHSLLQPISRAVAAPTAALTLGPISVSTGRLPPAGKNFLGRDDDLLRLDQAWQSRATTMVSVTAWAGVGKSALVNQWLTRLRRDKYRGAERVFGWSFDGQGGTRATSADPFLNSALTWFGESSSADSSWEKGERLAQVVQRSRSLLVLDGLEPLQYPPGPNEGLVRDEGLRAFLCSVAESNQGLCVVTSREPVADLDVYEPDPAIRLPLTKLHGEAGVHLLRSLGVQGEDSQLLAAVEEYEGHCLALTLLGSFLADVFRGDVSRRHEIGALTADMRLGAQAHRVLSSYESWFGDGPEMAALNWLSLIERPTDEQTLASLCQTAAAEAISAPLRGLGSIQWRQLLGRLERAHLVRVAEDGNWPSQGMARNPTLHLHPLVREHFRGRLRSQPQLWQQANERLFEYLQEQSEELPNTLEALVPLYDAVRHGCWAGRRREALEQVYWPRIRRGKQGYGARKLGAFQADVAALSQFFDQPFQRVADDLPKQWRVPVLGWTGFRLYTLGRLEEAAQALRTGLIELQHEGRRAEGAKLANQLFHVSFSRGEFAECQRLAEQMLAAAASDLEIDPRIWQVNFGLLLWQLGRRKEAEQEFRKAAPVDEVPEGHPLTPLCHRLPHRQAVHLVYLTTEGGDPALAEEYARPLDFFSLDGGIEDSDIPLDDLDAEGSGLQLKDEDRPGLVCSDFELRLSDDDDPAAEASDIFSLSGIGQLSTDEDPAAEASDIFSLSDSGPLSTSTLAKEEDDVFALDEFGLEPGGIASPGSSADLEIPCIDADIRTGNPSRRTRPGDSEVRLETPSVQKSASDSDEFELTLDDGPEPVLNAGSELRFGLVDSEDFEIELKEESHHSISSEETEESEEEDACTADLSERLHDSLCVLLGAHADIFRKEQEAAEKPADGAVDEAVAAELSGRLAELDQTVHDFRTAGIPEFVALTLLLRSRLLRVLSRTTDSLRDLEEMLQIAMRSGIKPLLVDGLLVKTLLMLDTSQLAQARDALARSVRLAKEIGYRRHALAHRFLAERLTAGT